MDTPVHERLTILELDNNLRQCRFPLGEPGTATFGFCGKPVHTGPYCKDHATRCYQPKLRG